MPQAGAVESLIAHFTLSTDTKQLPLLGHVPITASSVLGVDDLALIVGTCVPYPFFVVDPEEGLLVAADAGFLSLLGVDASTFQPPGLPWEGYIVPSDRGIFNTWERTLNGDNSVAFELRFCVAGGESSLAPARVKLTSFFWKQHRYLMGFVEGAEAGADHAEDLRRQLEQQKGRAFEAIKSSLRLYQINEKIRRTPRLARKLLHAASEEELFEQAAQVLTCEEGLGYRTATFLRLEGSCLRVAYSTQPGQEASYLLTEENRFSRFIRKNFKSGGSSGSGILVPLESRGNLLGFCEVIPHSQEKVFFDELGVVNEWQRDVLFDIGGIIALILDNLRLNREIKRQSTIDSLTQAYNRHYLVGRLTAEVERANRYARPVSVLFVDLDEFKHINDKYGHLQGDEVLRTMGRIFRSCLRDVDVVCRYGGDEFVVLFPETDSAMARAAAEKLLREIQSQTFRLLDDPARSIRITTSMGLASLKPGMKEESLLKAADAALYEAKNKGRNKLCVAE